ncbi:MAG TPA: hypothetical protein VL307_08875 [Chitinophagaceae bacterium]|nr:hypothetical protein [Chitinophagaceae bacterium]
MSQADATGGAAAYSVIGSQVSKLIGIGMLGFLLGIILLNGQGCNDKPADYQELIVAGKTDSLQVIFQGRIRQLKDSVKKYNGNTKTDSLLHVHYATRLTMATLELLAFEKANADTSLNYFSAMLQVHRDSLLNAITDTRWSDSIQMSRQLLFSYIDTSGLYSTTPVSKDIHLSIERSKYSTLYAFFSHNTVAGFWFIVSIGQITFWFLVVALLFGMLAPLKDRVNGVAPDLLSPGKWLLSAILPAIFFLLFTGIFYWVLIKETVIRDHYLLKGFNAKMLIYALFGYLAAVACFGMYLLMSLSLDQLNKTIYSASGSKRTSIFTDLQIEESFKTLKATFENSFLASAFILSFFVFWLGLLFTAINQTEAMQFYKAYSRKDFLSYDLVYLVGAMHTLILLLFYIPVRIKFNTMKLTQDQKLESDGKTQKLLGNLYETILTLLMTASPLLTSLLQKLLAGLIGTS